MKYLFPFLLITSTIFCQQSLTNKPSIFYIGVHLVYTSPIISNDELNESSRIKRYRWYIGPEHSFNKAFGLKLTAGYQLFSFLNLELSSSYVNAIEGTWRITDVQMDYHQQDYSIDLYNLFASALLKTNFSNNVEGFVKIGAGLLLRDRSVVGSLRGNMIIVSNYNNSQDDFNSFSTNIGLGIKWYIQPSIPLVLEYEKVNAYNKLSDLKVWNTSLGLHYNF